MVGARYWQGISLCGLMFALGAAAEEVPKWEPHIDVEAKPGSKRTLGEADLFLPLTQNARSLIFANIRARFDNDESREGNLGLGYRRMLDNGWNLGTYGYFDRRRSPDTGYYYNQVTLGAEALGQDWEFRANVYQPVGTRDRGIGTIGGGPSTATLAGTIISVTTPGSTTHEERALKGYDAEVGWRAPLFDSEATRQLRLYLGGYRFSDAGTTVEGPRVRTELSMDDLSWFNKGTRLFLGAEFQHDNARGDQGFLSLRLRIPLGKERDAARSLSAQERRMTAPVMRDVDIVTQRRATATTPTLVETVNAANPGGALTTANGQTVTTLLDSATTANLTNAVNGAANGSVILLSGTFNITNAVDLSGDKSLVAGSINVLTPSGKTAVLNSPATISGTSTNYLIAAPSNNTISGLTISAVSNNTFTRGIHVNDTASNVIILNNTITLTQTGNNGIIGILAGNQNQNMTISGNTVTVVGKAGWVATGVVLQGALGTSSGTISGNTLNVSGGASNYVVWVDSQATINAGSTGNVLVSGTCQGTPASGFVGFADGSTCP